MSDKVSIEQKIQQYKQANPMLKNLTDKQVLSIMVKNAQITLSEAQNISIYADTKSKADDTGITVPKQTKSQTINLESGRKIIIQDGTAKYYAADGEELKKEYFEKQEGQIEVKPSGRYSITKSGTTTYYAADGTELKESYFKQVERTDVKIKSTDGKTYNLNKTIEKRINNVSDNLKKSEDSNGFIGSAWSGFKNLTGIGDSSDKVREQQEAEKKLLQQFNSNEQKRPELFKNLTGADYTPENLEKFIKGEIKLKSEQALEGYKEGQEMAADVGADIVSGIAAVGIYTAAVAAAPFTGGASIAVGIAAAGASGALIKTGIKAADAAVGGREYTLNNAGQDAATGAFSGLIAPVTGGMGGAVGKTVATKLGIQAVKQVGKEVAEETVKGGVKQTIKTAFTNPTGYEYVGGNIAKRALATGAEMATDGAVGGAVDNAFRTAYDGGSLEDIGNSAVEGFVGGAIMSPLIGGGMKATGKAGQKLFGKDNVNIDANGNRVSVNEDGTVVKIDGNGNEISDAITRSTNSEQFSITERLSTASSRKDFVAIRDEIKKLPNGEEKTRLQQEYMKKYNEWSSDPARPDIRMEYKPETQKPVKIELKENEPVSIEKAKAMLSELGFPKDEIDAFDFDNNSLININFIHFVLKEKLFPDFKDVNFSSKEAAELRKDVYEFLKEEPYSMSKFLNKENLDEIKKYIQIDDIVKDCEIIIDTLQNSPFKENYDEYMRIIPILTKNGTVKMTPKEFEELRWINGNCLSYITPERVDFVNKINSKVPAEYKLSVNTFDCLGDTETLTDNLVSEYVNEVNRFLNHNINDRINLWSSSLKAKTAQMKEISDFLDEFPIELERNEKGLISSNEIERIMKRTDIKKIQKLLSEMTPEARRDVGVDGLPEPNSDIPFDKWRDFYNFISEGTFVEGSDIHPYNFINYVKSHNIKDLDSFTGYMQELKNTYAFKNDFKKDQFFNVLNGDYTGASALLKEIKSLTDDNKIFNNFITYNWEYIINDKNMDFKKALDSIASLKKQGVEINLNPDVKYIVKSKDPKNIVEKFRIMKQSGFEIEYSAAECVFDNPEISPKQLQDIIDNFDEQLSMKYGSTVDIDIVRHAALRRDSGSTIFCLTSKNGLYDDNWASILANCRQAINDDNKIFYDKFWNNPESIFDKRNLVYFAQYVNKENSDLALKICTTKDNELAFYKNQIEMVLKHTNKDNIALAERLCFDKDFPKEQIGSVLEHTNKDNISFVERLCFDKDFPKEQIGNILKHTNKDNIALAERLCTDEKLNFPKEYISLLLKTDCTELTLKRLNNPQFVKDVIDICESGSFISTLFIQAYNLLGKNSLAELTKTEKREFIEVLLANKKNLTAGISNKIEKEKIPLLPTNTNDYVLIMKKLANSLNIAMETVSDEQIAKFNKVINDFSHYLKSADLSKLDDINLTMPHSEFISRVQGMIKHLPLEEQAKIQEFYGFKIIDGKLSGYPNLNTKDLNLSEITDEQSIIVVNKLRKVIDDYINNNFVTVKDNPSLNQQLKELSKVLPEIFNQIDGSTSSVNMLKSLQKIVKNSSFEKLSESDKRVLMVATLLHNTDKVSNNISEAAFDAFFIAKKFNMTDEEAQKVYCIIESSDFVEKFMRTHKRPTEVNLRAAIIGQEREDKFDLMAFRLKEGNNFELAQMLYSSRFQEGFTRYFDKILAERIQQMKTTDFILPQTTTETYLSHAKLQTIKRDSNYYNVQIVESKDIKDFYAYIHTPEASFSTGGTRGANFANFDAFAVLNDDKVICTSYVGNNLAGLVREYHNGFIFKVQNDKQYVGYGNDIFSLAKNIPNMIVEYFRDRGFQANRGRGPKYEHRRMISNVLKSLLYGKDYYTMTIKIDAEITGIRQKYKAQIDNINLQRKNYIRNKFGTDKITHEQFKILRTDENFIKIENQIKALEKQQADEIKNIPGYADIKEMDELYIKRLDELKTKLGNRTMTMENIEEIDPEFAKAYREFLKRNGTEHTGEASLLRSDWHNEVLVSNPEISAIFTDNIDKIPEEYLIKAQEENLPIVIINI